VKSVVTGFSLTELMVATALLATATTGGIQAFARAQASRQEASITQQLHERAQYTYASLEPELQMAGFFGAGATPAVLADEGLPAGAAACGSSVIARLNVPVEAVRGWTLDCDSRGGGAMADSDVLIVRRASASLASSAEAGRGQWLSDSTVPANGRLFWRGDATWSPTSVAQGKELRELIVRVYYVARESDGNPGLPALRVKSLTSIAGEPAFIDTEVMPGVESMAVEVVPSADAPRAVRVALRIRADAPPAREDVSSRTLQVVRHFALRNVAH
jgi:hypothetical protein